MDNDKNIIDSVTNDQYKYGFVTDIETELIEKGLSEEVVCRISELKGEPEWLKEFRLKAYRRFLKMKPFLKTFEIASGLFTLSCIVFVLLRAVFFVFGR